MPGRGKRKPTKRSDLTLPPPNLSKPRAGEIVAVIRRILEENGRDYRGAYIFTILCLLTVSATTALSAWIMSPVVNQIFYERRGDLIPWICAALLGAFILRGLAGYGQAVSMGEILRRCGDDLTRANVLKQATTLAGFHSPFFLDDINYSYTPDDYSPMKTLHISIFDGKDWQISEKPVTE